MSRRYLLGSGLESRSGHDGEEKFLTLPEIEPLLSSSELVTTLTGLSRWHGKRENNEKIRHWKSMSTTSPVPYASACTGYEIPNGVNHAVTLGRKNAKHSVKYTKVYLHSKLRQLSMPDFECTAVCHGWQN
jgi:hypothetical protein